MIRIISSTLAACVALGLGVAHAHSDVIERCITHKKIVRIGVEEVLQNGLVLEKYDTNGNGKADIATLSTMRATKSESGEIRIDHSHHPTFIITNYDEDEESDQIFIDKKGEGNCSDLVLYLDFNTPQMKPTTPNMDARKEAGL